MKIVKFKKDKGNTYKLYFDDDTIIDLYDDVIIKYNLLANKSMDLKTFNEITSYNMFLNGYYKSIKFINRKLRSENEIRDYLKKIDIKGSDVDKIVKLLYKDGYLNKELFFKAYINDRYNLGNDGPNKIIKDLIKHGININQFSNYLYSLDWDIKIEKLVNKKIKSNHNLSNTILKTKIINDLVLLGYEKHDIIRILENSIFDNDLEILKKEYIKIKNKYSKKYNDNELDFKIKNYLYSKGFNIEDIKMVIYENKV